MRILVIAGTEDARGLVVELSKLAVKITVTVTTDYGASLVERAPNVDVEIGKWDADKMSDEIKRREIALLIDASHPYAKNASENAILAARGADVPYMRYERACVLGEDADVDHVIDYQHAVDLCNKYEGNILLTIGSNLLPTFAEGVENFSERVFARILSTHTMVERAQNLGLTPKHILALQGPFSKAINKAMIEHVDAKIMVTKASGSVGGTLEKIEAAREMGLKTIVIDRPNVSYGEVYRDMNELVDAVRQKIR